MVKRSKKVPEEMLQKRIAELTGKHHKKVASIPAKSSSTSKPVGRAAIEVVGDKNERVTPTVNVEQERTSAEAIGLKILHNALKDQNYNKLLPHQNRHDYEYRLRATATRGMVQLFNSLSKSRKAGASVESEEKHLTQDKTEEKKVLATKEAFLSALRQSSSTKPSFL
ncbi:hypothetical protein AGDE_01217 [Angomonas deanei]|nr:hypothetical protein AGDE_01217 [Angomonas deanei]|eukprot:EPY42706.1 hypothetical protein AGDE_01217 [Angomonas deanei]